MKAAIYTRVSTEDQNVARQTDELRVFAKARGWKVATEETDNLSGKDDKRPGYQRVMKLARTRKIDVVLVHKLDRWGRSVKQLIDSLAELEALGVKFVSLGDGFDLTTPNGRLQAQLLAAFAEFERAMISERVKSGLARRRRKGLRLGRAPRKPVDVVKLRKLAGRTSLWEMSRQLGVSRSAVRTALRAL